MNTETKRQTNFPTWRSEFGADFPIPPQIDNLVRDNLLTDTSRRTDDCPSFKRGDHRILIQHIDREKRKIQSGGWCYLILSGGRTSFQSGPEGLDVFLLRVANICHGGATRVPDRKQYEGEPYGHRDEVTADPARLAGTGWDVVTGGDAIFCYVPLDNVYEFKLTFDVLEDSHEKDGHVVLTRPILQIERDARLSDDTRYDYAYRGGPISMSLALKLLSMRATGVVWMYVEQLMELRRQPTQWAYIG